MIGAASSYSAPGGSLGPLATARKQAEELEGIFLNTLMKEMFGSIYDSEGDFGGGFAEETWRGMQAEQLAGAVAEAGGIGLANSIMADLISAQEAAQPAPPASGVYK